MHRRGLRGSAVQGMRRRPIEAVSSFPLSRQCMRAFAHTRYRFNPFAKRLGQNCRRCCRHRSKTRGVTFERGAPVPLIARERRDDRGVEERSQSRVKGTRRTVERSRHAPSRIQIGKGGTAKRETRSDITAMTRDMEGIPQTGRNQP